MGVRLNLTFLLLHRAEWKSIQRALQSETARKSGQLVMLILLRSTRTGKLLLQFREPALPLHQPASAVKASQDTSSELKSRRKPNKRKSLPCKVALVRAVLILH